MDDLSLAYSDAFQEGLSIRQYGRKPKPKREAKHATRGMYSAGCRCLPCTVANRLYVREWNRTHADQISKRASARYVARNKHRRRNQCHFCNQFGHNRRRHDKLEAKRREETVAKKNMEETLNAMKAATTLHGITATRILKGDRYTARVDPKHGMGYSHAVAEMDGYAIDTPSGDHVFVSDLMLKAAHSVRTFQSEANGSTNGKGQLHTGRTTT